MMMLVITVLLTIAPLWIVSELKEIRKRVERLIDLEVLAQRAQLEEKKAL